MLGEIKDKNQVDLLVSRGEEAAPLPDLKGCKAVEFDKPEDIYDQVRGVATLSRRGYGTKTSVVDAIGAGLWACVHPRILKRMPTELHSACIPIDPTRKGDVKDSLRIIKHAPKVSATSGVQALKKRAAKTLSLALALG